MAKKHSNCTLQTLHTAQMQRSILIFFVMALLGCSKTPQETAPQAVTIHGVWHPANYPQLEVQFTDSTILQRIGYPLIVGYSIRLVEGKLTPGSTAKYTYTTPLSTQSTFNLTFVNLTDTNCEVIRDFDPVKLRR